ncbi:MAG: cytochrome c [Cyclobacteriaceae bacterium]|nr:cytochrome c [Cyclobacteriaceae bacterium]
MKHRHINLSLVVVVVFGLAIFFTLSCSSDTAEGKVERVDRVKMRQYMVRGEILYQQHCQNCHKADGTGLGRLYPPLAQSDYMLESRERTARLIRYGLQGAIIVNGVEYNQPMPANPNLMPLDIAQIMTFIYNSWENEEGLVEVNDVVEYLK